MRQLSVSFIIPAYNEELFLPYVLKSIKKHTPKALSYEVIVADNGSEDKTVDLAKEYATQVIINKDATVGGLRNLAVKAAKGSVLVFLDADILLTDAWQQNFMDAYRSLLDTPYQVTGSRCGIPSAASWIEKTWFKPLLAHSAKYINSGHLITSRELFDAVGGFNVKLETGEDYAFGKSAQQANAAIVNNPSLAVVHKGYPKTIYQFMHREMWHGRGDCDSFRSIGSSKVAMASIFFMFLHLLAAIGFAVSSSTVSIVAMLFILFMCVGASISKHDARTIKNIILISLLYYLYFVSRFLSCVSFLSVRSVKRKEGN